MTEDQQLQLEMPLEEWSKRQHDLYFKKDSTPESVTNEPMKIRQLLDSKAIQGDIPQDQDERWFFVLILGFVIWWWLTK